MVPIALSYHSLSGEEYWRVHDPLESAICTDPHFGIINNPLLLELERAPVVDIVANVLFVREDLVDGAARPELAKIGFDTLFIELSRDLTFYASAIDE